jgi:hypothetical protein
MSAEFYRAQAALCFRLVRAAPQERIAREILLLATEYDHKAIELETVDGIEADLDSSPRIDSPVSVSTSGHEATKASNSSVVAAFTVACFAPVLISPIAR